MFENVTYDFYSDTLGRAIIPTENDFNAFKLQNIQEMKKLLPYLEALEINGIDSAVCLMIEVDYEADYNLKNNSSILASESVTGHSVSFDNTIKSKEIELNAKSIEIKKMDRIKLFCRLCVGVV